MWTVMWTVFTVLAALAGVEDQDPDLRDAVVLVRQGSGLCAGTVIDDEGTVVTAYHCIASGGRIIVENREGLRGRARVVVVRARDDVAILAAPELAQTMHIDVQRDPPMAGDRVRVIGHPFGTRLPGGFLLGTLRWAMAEGEVSAVGDRAIQISAPVNPGNSGGPVLDESGRLVAIVSRRLPGDGLGFAARADRLELAEERGRRLDPWGGTVSAGVLGAAWEGNGGYLSFGGYAELALRDRVFISGSAAFAPSPRWHAVRFGRVVWSAAEARLGLRQRLFTGPWSVRLDGWGGVVHLQEVAAEPDSLLTTQRGMTSPAIGGALTIGGITLDGAAVLAEGEWGFRGMVVLRVPGVLWMF